MLNDAECVSLLEEIFSTRDELLNRIRNMTLKEGYVTTIKKSKSGCYVIIGCNRGGKYRGTSVPLSEGKRMSGSRLVNCPFQMLRKKKVGKPWKVEIKDVSPNHEPSSDISGHPFCRRFSKEEENRFFWSHLRGFIFNYLMEVSLIIMVKEKDVHTREMGLVLLR
ncbi:hypothetical protein RHGRI_001916 [Rhododendron griersonianum]|uniref:Uncharacterized protein n=1 Tax=Rhododendron griersonianum TaxID=479676 RepID=A0AAV6LPZ4_9ERIC|nr:hypothetical protein RHGRI_001916 [Rhododendron griersonianum]